MNAEKAKNAVIVMLVALNVFIFGLIFRADAAFRLTPGHQAAIESVLANSGILLDAAIKRDFLPRQQLQMATFDYGFMKELLLEGPIHIARQFPRVTSFEGQCAGRVTIEWDVGGEIFYFERPGGLGPPAEIAVDEAKAHAEALLQRMLEVYPDLRFAFYSAAMGHRGHVLVYHGVYEDYKIPSNIVEFTVDGNGIYVIWARFSIPEGFTGIRRDIFSANEALFTLSRYALENFTGDMLTISEMQMVYYLVTNMHAPNNMAEPAYMFTITDPQNPAGHIHIVVNAYRNAVIRSGRLEI